MKCPQCNGPLFVEAKLNARDECYIGSLNCMKCGDISRTHHCPNADAARYYACRAYIGIQDDQIFDLKQKLKGRI